MELRPASWHDIQSWLVDYQKRSKNTEMPPEQGEIVGIYNENQLIGYFIVVTYKNGLLEIHQGYLAPKARHQDLSREAMHELEKLAKGKGFNQILLGTNRPPHSYIKFMHSMGYRVKRTVFNKEI